jgi:hypothetical protein
MGAIADLHSHRSAEKQTRSFPPTWFPPGHKHADAVVARVAAFEAATLSNRKLARYCLRSMERLLIGVDRTAMLRRGNACF